MTSPPVSPDRRARIRGCLLAGAVGDALGAPVEFDPLEAIRDRHGPAGVTELIPSAFGRAGLITDDTQMTLFTAEALLEHGHVGDALHAAYLRWLLTQERAGPPDGATGLAAQPWLYAARAPGNACLSGLRSGLRATLARPVNPTSKGCGTVMRSAPFGLVVSSPDRVADAAIEGAVLTHGHPTARFAAAGLALVVHHLLAGADLPAAVDATIRHLHTRPGHEETTAALRAAVDAAAQGPPTPERLERLGAGWVAEEALAMSVYCALAHPGAAEMRDALLLAVNHGGDSDSTGAITGNLLGAWQGEAAVPADWAAQVEGRETVLDLADRLAGSHVIELRTVAAGAADVARAQRLSRVRGMLLGLALGDALTRAHQPDPARLLGTSTTQLACVTTEGLIRASVRFDHRGIGPAPEVVWFAYRRWARIQGIETAEPIELTGWLHRVPALHERRGNAPATVTALQAARTTFPEPAPRTSRGHHALTRVLPAAGIDAPTPWLAEIIGFTHGDPDTVRAALDGIAAVRQVLASGRAPDDADGRPLPAVAPDHTARSALRGGLALAARCPSAEHVAEILYSARAAPAPGAVGPVAGALLGARYGAEALPVELVARLELAWVVDTLARDLVAQVADTPSGTAYSDAPDEHWWERYPGG